MNFIRKIAGAMLFGTAFVSSMASASVIYSEDFQNAAFQGASLGLTGTELSSERYASTTYYNINNANGWSFSGSTYLAVGSNGDAGALLNESTGSAITVVGLTSGLEYFLSFNHSGDNRPNQAYEITLNINGVPVALTSPRSWTTNGPGVTETIYFIASSNSVTFNFGETSHTQSSPIIDNIVIETPEPASLALLGLALAGLGLSRRKKS